MGLKHRYRHKHSLTTTTTTSSVQLIVESPSIQNARTRLLNFVTTTAITSREVWVSDLCLQLLWQISHGLHCKSPEHTKSISLNGDEKERSGSGAFERFVNVLSGNGGSGSSGGDGGSDGSGLINHSIPVNSERTEAAIAQLVIVLRECRLPAKEQRQRLNKWLSVATDVLKKVC